jgi:hypothetical protein
MGAAHFIVLNNPKPGFDTFVNGKAIAREAPAIEKIGKKLKIPDINDLMSFAIAAAEFGADPDSPGAQEKWFSAQEGLKWVRAVQTFIRSKPTSVKAVERVLSELTEYDELLQQAAKIKARWHFEMDF